MADTTKKHIPMPFHDESEEAYSKRLDDLGITDDDFEDALEDEIPMSDNDVTDATFHDDEEGVAPQGDEGKKEFQGRK